MPAPPDITLLNSYNPYSYNDPSINHLSPAQKPYVNPNSSQFLDVGFHRIISIFRSPPFGAGFLSLGTFFLILFSSDILLRQAIYATLGIIVTLSTLGLLALVVLILFLL